MSMDYRLSQQTSYSVVTGTFVLGIHGKIPGVYKQYNFTRLESSGVKVGKKTRNPQFEKDCHSVICLD